MYWKTTNLAALKQMPVWATLEKNVQDSIEEDFPKLSDWKYTHGSIPTNTYWEAETNTVVFPTPINLADLQQVYDATIKDWLWLPNRSPSDPYFGELSSDGLRLKVKGLHPNAQKTDRLIGGMNIIIPFGSPLMDTTTYKDYPSDWTTPITMLDLNQSNDKITYDGSFPTMVLDMKSLKRNPSSYVWAKCSDLLYLSLKPDNTVNNGSNDSTELSVMKEKLNKVDILVKSLVETIK